MNRFFQWLIVAALVLVSTYALTGSSTVTVKDSAGATKTFFVTTDGGGNFYSANVICDQAAAAACASVGTAGSPSTNALTVQGVTLGHGTAANAMRVELPTDGTGLVNATQSGTWNIGTVTTLSALTGGGVASGSADSGNPVKVGCKFNAAVLALTDGNRADCQADSGANQKVSFGMAATTLSGWTSGTGLNATQTLLANHGAPAILLQLNQTSTISAGATTIEGTYDGTNWVSVPVAQILNPNTFANLTNPYTLVASTNQPFLILTQGYQSVRLKLSTQITGSATVTPFVTLLNYNPALGALLNPLAAGSAIIGKVGIDQTTPGTTNSVSFGTDPCSFLAKTTLAIDQATDTQIISGTSSKKTYVCSLSIIAAAAEAVSLVVGTGSVCGTNTVAMLGSTTDANGLSLAANGGLTLGSGIATIAGGLGSNADNVCIRQGGTSRIAGNLTYVQN